MLVSFLVTGGSDEPTPVLDAVVVPYAVLLLVGGAYILSLPRRSASWECPACEYDLRGHETPKPVCPECGPISPSTARTKAGVPRSHRATA